MTAIFQSSENQISESWLCCCTKTSRADSEVGMDRIRGWSACHNIGGIQSDILEWWKELTEYKSIIFREKKRWHFKYLLWYKEINSNLDGKGLCVNQETLGVQNLIRISISQTSKQNLNLNKIKSLISTNICKNLSYREIISFKKNCNWFYFSSSKFLKMVSNHAVLILKFLQLFRNLFRLTASQLFC